MTKISIRSCFFLVFSPLLSSRSSAINNSLLLLLSLDTYIKKTKTKNILIYKHDGIAFTSFNNDNNRETGQHHSHQNSINFKSAAFCMHLRYVSSGLRNRDSFVGRSSLPISKCQRRASVEKRRNNTQKRETAESIRVIR